MRLLPWALFAIAAVAALILYMHRPSSRVLQSQIAAVEMAADYVDELRGATPSPASKNLRQAMLADPGLAEAWSRTLREASDTLKHEQTRW